MANDGSRDKERAIQALAGTLPAALSGLAGLAYNYWWSWATGGAALFRRIDPDRWQRCAENPVRLLQEVPRDRLAVLARDSAFLAELGVLYSAMQQHLDRPHAVGSGTAPIVHMCAEYGVHASLPVYAGGLGVLMGDFLKQESDQALPVAGVGLLYWQGSFQQRLDQSGWQHEYWLETDAARLPMVQVTGPDGSPLTVHVPARGHEVAVRIWRVDIGRVPLYLLDTNLQDNLPSDRWITSRLYVGDREMRLAQYAILGIGGIRALRAMGVSPSLIHLNEGHAALAGLELAREAIAGGLSFDAALDLARGMTRFTTHTPVAAGHDTFSTDDLRLALGRLPDSLGMDWSRFVDLGRVRPGDEAEPFGMTPFAIRVSRDVNGVSRKHGEVARVMWQGMWPERAVEAVPISHITNGVHLPSWMAPEMQALLDAYLPHGWHQTMDEPETWQAIDSIPDEELWSVRCRLRQQLVDYVRERSVWDRLSRGEPAAYAESARQIWDDRTLTIGFVRRIATYKRLYLLSAAPDRAVRLLRREPGLQVLIAGKAHPQDEEAKRTVQTIFDVSRSTGVGDRAVFLENLDLGMESRLAAGCDVWLNLPRPPNEASGTSGMKSALNGGLQLSVLDGWWAEAYDGLNGWAIDTPIDAPAAEQDSHDAARLFELLETEVLPLFYDRQSPESVPHGWARKIKYSMQTIGPRFNAQRMVNDYLAGLVIPTEA
jgi:starch phosphorylase